MAGRGRCKNRTTRAVSLFHSRAAGAWHRRVEPEW
jgi:hypothetical protein